MALDDAELRIPWGLRRIRIPVAEIAGVGLVYGLYPLGTGYLKPNRWALTVWRANGSRETVEAISAFLSAERGIAVKPRKVTEELVTVLSPRQMWSASPIPVPGTSPGSYVIEWWLFRDHTVCSNEPRCSST